MGDVGDKLGFQTLALQPLLHGLVHTYADGVKVLGVTFDIEVHFFRVQLCVQISGSQGRAHVPDLLQLESHPRGCHHQSRVQHGSQQENKEAAAQKQQDQKGLPSQDAYDAKHYPPGHGQDAHQLHHSIPAPPPHPGAPPAQPPEDGVAPPLAFFEPGSQGQQQGQRSRRLNARRQAEHGNLQRDGSALFGRQIRKRRQKEQRQVQAQIQVQGNPVLPIQRDPLPARLTACGAEEKNQRSQRQGVQ